METHTREFARSGREKLTGLVKNGTFILVPSSTNPEGTWIFGYWLMSQLKRAGNGIHWKSSLVAQNYTDRESTKIATKAPTVHRFSQRFRLSLPASLNVTESFTRDVTQSYVQSGSALKRDIYISGPTEMKLPPETVFKLFLLWWLVSVNFQCNPLSRITYKGPSQALVCNTGEWISLAIYRYQPPHRPAAHIQRKCGPMCDHRLRRRQTYPDGDPAGLRQHGHRQSLIHARRRT